MLRGVFRRRRRSPRGQVRALALCALWATLGTCGRSPLPSTELGGRAFGTTWSLRLVAPEGEAREDELQRIVEQVLERIDLAASTWRTDSELSAIAALEPGVPQAISPDLALILDVAREVHELSGGAFDPTVGPLVAVHGFGAQASRNSPTPEEIRAARAQVDFDAFQWSQGQLTKARAGVSLDLSGVAKGYAVDLAADALLAAGESRFLLEIGGEIRVHGLRPTDSPWILGIFEPVAGRVIHGTVELSERALATSGDYRAFRELPDGTRVSHTVDPRSGRPASSGVASVTVLDSRCARADALATAVMVLGAEEGLQLVEALPGVEAYLLLHAPDGFEARATSGFPPVAPVRR